MNCTSHNVKVTEGNAFALILPLKSRHYVAEQPIDEDIDITLLQNVVVKVGGVTWEDVSLAVEGVTIGIPSTQARGTYNVELTAVYNDINIRAAYFECFTIVAWSYQSDVQNYIPDSPIIAEAAFFVAGNWTDEELEQLKEEYREKNAQLDQAIADAEEAKREWEQKAAELDDVAQESTLTQGVQDIREDISHIDIDTSDLAKQGTNPDATNTAILTAAQNAGADTQAVAQSYDILQAKGVAIPEHTTDRTAQNLPATIDQINPAFVGTCYTSSVPRVNQHGCENYNYSGVEVVPSSWANSFLNNIYVKRIEGFRIASCTNLAAFAQGATSLEYVDFRNVDFSQCTNFSSAIFKASALKKIYFTNADMRAATTIAQMFQESQNLEWADFSGTKVSSSLTNINYLFQSAGMKVETLVGDHTIDEVIDNNICIFEGLNIAFSFYSTMPLINRASLRALINGLADRTGLSALTCSLGGTNLTKLTADDIAIATNKNWTLA